MEAFVEVMAGSILSSFDDVLSFFLQVIFTSEVLACDIDNASWSCHKALMLTRTILIHLT